MAIPNDFSLYRGDTYEEDWTFTLINGSPANLGGAKLYFTIKSVPTAADPGTLQLSSPSNGIVITDAPNGKATLTITATQTGNLSVGTTYYYDIQITDIAGRVRTLVTGKLTVLQDITVST